MWSFSNRFVRELPADPSSAPGRRQVFGAAYSRVAPTRVGEPRLLAHSVEMAETLGISETQLRSPELTDVLAGNRLLDGMEPFAACYGGHQFGHWAGQLGDGRAITLGEVLGVDGDHWELQLKGAGATPYSRTADGRAVLRSSVREFLCSEAMFHLGVPTTRALSLVTTGERILRDMFYDGNAKHEPGAVVCRVAPTFLRFGNFEILASRNDVETLRQLADFTLRHYFPEIGAPGAQSYLGMLVEVARRTADMIVHWQRVGFVHGVMNTDNMSVLGLTIDYGPYGWLEPYDPRWTPNTTDAGGRRYAFGQQPRIAFWNLLRFGEALSMLIGSGAAVQDALSYFPRMLDAKINEMMAQKLGLPLADPYLTGALFELLEELEMDMTIFFRKLAGLTSDDTEPLRAARYGEPLRSEQQAWMKQWLRDYLHRAREAGVPDEERARLMNRVNPKYVLRNYMAQLAIEAAEGGDASVLEELHEVLRHPYHEQPASERWANPRPEWARDKPGCSTLSCSS